MASPDAVYRSTIKRLYAVEASLPVMLAFAKRNRDNVDESTVCPYLDAAAAEPLTASPKPATEVFARVAPLANKFA